MGAVTTALAPVFGSATGRVRTLRNWDAAVRAPLPQCRRIGFVQLGIHSGASSTAARVATVLAGRRAGSVLAVDASPSPHGLLPLLGATGGDPEGAAVGARATTAAEARTGLPRSPAGCHALDLHPSVPSVPSGQTSADRWSAAVGPIARFFDVVVTDWGLRHPAYDLEPVLSSSHAVCLVVRAGDAAVDAAAALLDTQPGRNIVIALVAADRGDRRLPHAVVIGDDAGPRGRHRAGCLRLAAELMGPIGGDGRDR